MDQGLKLGKEITTLCSSLKNKYKKIIIIKKKKKNAEHGYCVHPDWPLPLATLEQWGPSIKIKGQGPLPYFGVPGFLTKHALQSTKIQ